MLHMNRYALRLLAVPILYGMACLQVSAEPIVINGTGFSTGINAGFGNAVGSNSELSIFSDAIGNVNWELTTGGGNLDNANTVVIYIDTDNGATGYADTTGFTDTGSSPTFDDLRAATSATNGTERSDVFFAPGFMADHALAFNSGLGVLFDLDIAGHLYIDNVEGAGFGAGGPYEFSHTMADLDLDVDGTFRYMLTYLDPVGTFRSNEFHGVADSSVPDTNIGFDDITLSSGDFNTFNSLAIDPYTDGDTDNDTVVEFEDDFFPIRDHWLETTATFPGLTRSDGDLNFDGTVDILDFREWKEAFNGPPAMIASALASLGKTQVPEPGSFVLLLTGCFAAIAVLRKGRPQS